MTTEMNDVLESQKRCTTTWKAIWFLNPCQIYSISLCTREVWLVHPSHFWSSVVRKQRNVHIGCTIIAKLFQSHIHPTLIDSIRFTLTIRNSSSRTISLFLKFSGISDSRCSFPGNRQTKLFSSLWHDYCLSPVANVEPRNPGCRNIRSV